jgi:acetyltransferase-like isoleucine patch superfamily enzyme
MKTANQFWISTVLRTHNQACKNDDSSTSKTTVTQCPDTAKSSPRRIYRSLRNQAARSARLWLLNHSGAHGIGRAAAWLACWNTKPYHQRAHLAEATPNGFIAPSASVSHLDVRLGKNVYLGDRVVISDTGGGGQVDLGDKTSLFGNSFLMTGSGGEIRIGCGTHIQPGCHLHAQIANITIGQHVEVASNCGFFSYNHGIDRDRLIMDQPLESKGGIIIGDGAWLGYGSTILQGVTVGAGAVVGAGSVVTRNIPDNAIAVGSPAKVIGYRPSSSHS